MIWYLFASAILLYCFEIIGRYVLYKLNINNFKCSFGIGIIVFLAYAYVTTSLIGAINCSFFIVSVIYMLFFVASIILILKDKSNLSFKIDVTDLLLLIIFEAVMIYFAYNTTLGDLNGFDSTFYLNLVSSNINSNSMNIGYFYNSMNQVKIGNIYIFQSFYYIASFISWGLTYIINFFHNTYYQTVYIWVFQILFNALFYSLIINSINITKIKEKRILKVLILLFFLLVYGRLYYYNVFGFFGNTYRIITIGYSTLILYLLTKSQKNKGLLLLLVSSLLASAAVSSSGVFIDIFIMFAAYFILCNKYDDILKYYSFVLLFVVTNLLATSLHISIAFCIIMSFVLSLVLFIFYRQFNKFLSKKIVLIVLLCISFITMFILSLIVTKNPFDFSSFFVNYSEEADMTINYFNLLSSKYLIFLKIFILLLIISSFLFVKKEDFIKFTCILFICIFNPFCVPVLNKILSVYFRAFDIIVNPFTIIFYIECILTLFKGKTFYNSFLYLILIVVFIQNNPLKPLYYHESFNPEYSINIKYDDRYNGEYKMLQGEIDVINAVYDDCAYNKVSTPYIISPNLLTQSIIPNGRYLFTRNEHDGCPYISESERQLFAIFYPERYLGDSAIGIIPNYDNIKQYIKEAGIDYLVIDKSKEYYDKNNNEYSYLYYKVLDDFYAMFENKRYLVIRCFDQ